MTRPEHATGASEGLALTIQLCADQLDQLAERAASLLEQRRDDGFLDTDAAASYLNLTRSAVYHLVERHKLPCRRAGGRLLFDKRELRRWVEKQP